MAARLGDKAGAVIETCWESRLRVLRWDTQAESSGCLHLGGTQWRTILGVLVCLAKLACSTHTLKKFQESLTGHLCPHCKSHVGNSHVAGPPHQTARMQLPMIPKRKLKSVLLCVMPAAPRRPPKTLQER